MAIIQCEECGKEISDKAVSCIHCGCPIHSEEIKTVKTKPIETQTIEATGKGWKLLQAVGLIVLIIGIIACIASDKGPDGESINPWIGFTGLFIHLFARVGGWWHHG